MSRYPLLYQLNTRVYLRQLAAKHQRPTSLDDISDDYLQDLAGQGFEWLWLLGVWQTGELGQRISREHPSWQQEFRETLNDLSDEDIPGSCFAIQDYRVSADLGGNQAMLRLKQRAHAVGLKVMLDFVPNHMAPDHPWVDLRPEFFIQGSAEDLQQQPDNYIELSTHQGKGVFAHGRDPYFPGWPDTVQLDYSNPASHSAMQQELLRIAKLCDGLRCDMAMLIEPQIFEQTWGERPSDFWPQAIAQVKAAPPEFLFMAEVYWDREWAMLQQGFDFAYDKVLLDRLLEGNVDSVRGHLHAEADYQNGLARFLENHDEQRAAKQFHPAKHQAAALLTYLVPGLRFFHQGQEHGWLTHIPPHLNRGPVEQNNQLLAEFYQRLIKLLKRPVLREGEWQLLDLHGQTGAHAVISFRWALEGQAPLLVAVNFSEQAAQLHLELSKCIGQGNLNAVMTSREGALAGDSAFPTELVELEAWGYVVAELAQD